MEVKEICKEILEKGLEGFLLTECPNKERDASGTCCNGCIFGDDRECLEESDLKEVAEEYLRIRKLLDKKILTTEELEDLESSSLVTNVENNGHSGVGELNNYVWYTVQVYQEEFDAYAE